MIIAMSERVLFIEVQGLLRLQYQAFLNQLFSIKKLTIMEIALERKNQNKFWQIKLISINLTQISKLAAVNQTMTESLRSLKRQTMTK
jgi:hypothetical protein